MSGRVLCVVQARMGSTRLPGKVLQELGGRPMLRFMLDRLATLDVDDLVVATSMLDRDNPIVEVAHAAGRPALRGSEGDVLSRFIAAIDAFPGTEHVVRLTADCPLTDWRLVERVIARHLATRADYTSNVFPRTFPKGLDVEVVRADALRAAHAEAVDLAEREHVTPFVYRRPERFRLANFRNADGLGDEWWTVDTAEDLERVRALVAKIEDDGFSWEQMLAAAGKRFVPPPGQVHLVPARVEHFAFVLAVRNDDDAIRWMRHAHRITPEQHACWYDHALEDPAIRLRVAMLDGEPVGTVRADVRDAGVAEVGIAVTPARRGQGLGKALLDALIADCAADPQVVELVAEIHPDNEASRRAFVAVGFVPAGTRDGFDVLHRPVQPPMEKP